MALLAYPKQSLLNKVTITEVDVAPDLSSAKVFFSTFEGVDLEEVMKVLQGEAKALRKMLAHTLNLRLTPKLNFIYDESIERGRRISVLIDTAVANDKKSST